MLSNFAPQRREAGWGRGEPEDPTGFIPVVKEFGEIESRWVTLVGDNLSDDVTDAELLFGLMQQDGATIGGNIFGTNSMSTGYLGWKSTRVFVLNCH